MPDPSLRNASTGNGSMVTVRFASTGNGCMVTAFYFALGSNGTVKEETGKAV